MSARRDASTRRAPLRALAALASPATSVEIELDGGALVATHLDRVYWPGDDAHAAITKRDYLAYLIAVSPAMLEHLADRPLTLFRWPEGIAGKRVLEKHWKIALPPFVERVDVFSESKGRPDQYLLCNNLATLLWLANLGTLEFHVWHSRVREGSDVTDAGTDFARSAVALQDSLLERPDYVLFDIDPFIYRGDEAKGKEPTAHPAAFAKALEVAHALKPLLDSLGLESLVKTSGKTGLHIIVPIARSLRFDAVRDIARFIAAHLMREHPKLITLDWSVERRTGKVFVDANMNVRGKSMTAPYSPRGLPGAPVSLPLEWRDLPKADPARFRIPDVAAMLKRRGDPWRGWLQRKQELESALRGTRADAETVPERLARRTTGRKAARRNHAGA
jgi:bifunctional non-homologous end joining protein LigD